MAKRRAEAEDEDDDEPLSDEEETVAKKRPRTGPKTGVEEYDDLIALGEQQDADQTRLAKRMKNGGTGAAEGGVIRAIYLENFLCHSRLSFTFGPNMNFIIGHNGSGKSAVLTALVVVLGGKSNSTGRGSGVKDFVKSGTDRALVRVTIRNDGSDPFKFDEFGESIDIERSITKEGQTQYKIKGHTRQKALTGKIARTTLGHILDHYDIQVDNPMTVLNQDQSRHFLANADEGKKYALFMEGTQLKQLQDAYSEMERGLQQMRDSIKVIDDNIPALKNDSNKWKKERDSMKNATAMRDRVRKLKQDLAWAYPIQKKGEMDVVDAEKAKHEQKLEAAQGKIDTAEGTKSTLKTEIEGHNSFLRELKKRRDDEFRERGHEALQARRAQLTEKKAKHQEMLDRIEKELPLTETALKDIYARRNRIQQEVTEAGESRQAAQSHLQHVEGNLSSLRQRQGSGDPLAAFGRNLRAVYQAIDRAQWVHSKPIGPLGIHVSLKDSEARYQRLLDTMLSSTLTSWAVRDWRDKRTLLSIFQQCISRDGTTIFSNGRETKQPPTIIEHAGELFDFTNGDFRHMHPTVLSKLDVNDEQVVRLLVNSNSIEGIFCAPTRREADDVAKNFHRPGRTVQVWAADMFRVNSTRTGGLQSTVINGHSGLSVLSKDIASEINSLQHQLTEAQTAFQSRSQEFDLKRRELQGVEAQYREADAKLKKLKQGNDLAEREMSKIDMELEQAVPADMTIFEENIEAQERKIKYEVDQMVLLELEIEAQRKALEPTRLEREKARAEITKQNQRTDDIERRVAQADKIRKQAEADKAHWVKKHQQISAQIADCDERMEVLRNAYETWHRAAMDYTEGEERNPEKSPEALQAEMNAAEAALQKSNARHRYPIDHVEQMLHDAQEAWQLAEKQSHDLRVLYEKLGDAHQKRLLSWQRMKTDFANTVKRNFHKHCSRRNFVGEIEFAHQEKRLKMKVQTEEVLNRDGARASMNKHNSKDPRALSGGETSFATICLLLSIWECVACPLRCLDEFDVFMDAHNRKLAMSLLMETAKYQTDRQYILITPQDMAGVTFGPGVKAHKMPDPERGTGRQSRLDFPTAT
ncbi:Structural maintenance of chromosomes protein 6 [Naganishia albida]|nr:Structural maintenance of chromosomes protein 6 [Naganishia albida]